MSTAPRIVAIGGGELKELETAAIDRRVIELTGRNRPEALFVPTASGDDADYQETFRRVYGGRFGCRTRTLELIGNPPPFEEMSALVLESDLIYVGGGNTYRMMRTWRRSGLDAILAKAASRGVVLSGVSAGAICWFRYGHSDSRSFSSSPEWDYIRVTGLGLVNALYCPHYHKERREAPLSRMIARRGGVAIACDNNAAIEIVGEHYRVIRSSEEARAYRILRNDGHVVAEELTPYGDHRALAGLLRRRSRHATPETVVVPENGTTREVDGRRSAIS